MEEADGGAVGLSEDGQCFGCRPWSSAVTSPSYRYPNWSSADELDPGEASYLRGDTAAAAADDGEPSAEGADQLGSSLARENWHPWVGMHIN